MESVALDFVTDCGRGQSSGPKTELGSTLQLVQMTRRDLEELTVALGENRPFTKDLFNRFGERVSKLLEQSQVLAPTEDVGDEFFLRNLQFQERFKEVKKSLELNSYNRSQAAACLRTSARALDAHVLTFFHDHEESRIAMRRREKILSDSVYLRQQWAYMRMRVEDALNEDGIQDQLRYAATALAAFFEGRCLRLVRRDDLEILLNLRDRIKETLKSSSRQNSPEAKRLLSDLRSAMNLLSAINSREELQRRDRALAQDLLPGQRQANGASILTTALLFVGLVPEVDRVAIQGGRITDEHLALIKQAVGWSPA